MEKDLWLHLKNSNKPIVLYGMGNGADKILDTLNQKNIPVKGIFATDEFVRNKVFRGFNLTTYSALKEEFNNMIILMCFGSSRNEVMKTVEFLSSEQEFYAPDVPVYGEGLFDYEYYLNNKEYFDFIKSKLADKISVNTFECIINYKLSGDINYLKKCESDYNEPYNSFLHFSDNEHFLDLGAYNGDTVKDFILHCPDYKGITALEPDIKTFKKLINNTKDYPYTECINACVSDHDGKEVFKMKGGRNSVISSDGVEINSITIDSVNKKNNISFIKYDVEGEEIKAIKGAFSTIKNNKPKMLISCYHRTDDLLTIPKEIFSIRKDYKLYMRHFKYIPAWDTNFYFI